MRKSQLLAAVSLAILGVAVGALAMWTSNSGPWAPHYKDLLGQWWNIDPSRPGDWLQIRYTGKVEGVETYDIEHSGGRTEAMFGGGGIWWEKPSDGGFANRSKVEFDDGREYAIALLDTVPPLLAVWGPPAGPEGARPWVEEALLDKCEALSRSVGSQRRDALLRTSVELGRIIGAGLLDRLRVEMELSAACRLNGLAADDFDGVEKAIGTGIDEGMTNPVTSPEANSTGHRLVARFAKSRPLASSTDDSR